MTVRTARGIAAAAAAGGLALLLWTLKSVGVDLVAADVERLGAGFAVIVALGGVRHVLRAAAWRLCLDAGDRPSLGASAAAYVAGDAIGNVTPFGILISEPSKIVLMRGRIAADVAVPALAIENLVYGATVAAMLIGGTAALLWAFDVAPAIRASAAATIAAAIVCAAAAIYVVVGRRRVVSGVVSRLGRPSERIRAAEDRVFDFARHHPARIAPVVTLECAYHAAAVAEIWIALRLITGAAPSLLTAFVLEYVNRAITIAFQFVPLWVGVDEAGTALMTSAFGLAGATGVALALARKGRVAVWTAAGLAIAGIFRPRPVFTNGEDADRYRWRERIPGTAARGGPRH